MLETVFYSLRLFVVGGVRIAMAMVVVGHKMSWLYTTLSTSYRLIIWPEAICVAMATCNFVGKMLLTSIISMSNFTFIVCIVCDL